MSKRLDRGIPAGTEGRFSRDQIRLDNQSAQASGYLGKWKSGYSAGTTAVLWRCSDSRFVVPAMGVAEVGSIAAVPLPGFLRTVKGSVNVLLNHDPCGGRSVKKVQEEEGPQSGRKGAAAYVEKYVYSSEPDYNGLANGLEVTRVTQRPTLIATQEHSTGKLNDIKVMLPHFGATGATTYLDPLVTEAVNEVIITGDYGEDGKTSATFATIAPIVEPFKQFLKQYGEVTSTITEPDESVIDPTAVLVTTEFAGLQRFPRTLGAHRNTVFTVTVPPVQPDGRYPEGYITDPFDQVHYPISHALGNPEQDPNKPFARLAKGGTLIIEASNEGQLIKMASEIFARSEIIEWYKSDEQNNSQNDNQILLFVSNSGEIDHTYTYKEYLEKYGFGRTI